MLRQVYGRRHGVVHRGLTPRRDPGQAPAEEVPIGRPALEQDRLVGERVHEDLVLGIEQLVEETIERILRRPHLVACHASRRVQHDAQAHRHALAAEVRDGLPRIVLEDEEVLLAEVRDEASLLIRDRGGDVDDLDARPKPGTPRLLLADEHGPRSDQQAQEDGRSGRPGRGAGCADHGPSPGPCARVETLSAAPRRATHVARATATGRERRPKAASLPRVPGDPRAPARSFPTGS